MRRYRRLVLMDRLIPFLAAFVGLVALAGAVVVQYAADARSRAVLEEIVALRTDIDALGQRVPTPVPAAVDEAAIAAANGTIDALLALQDRMNALEAAWAARPAPAAAAPVDVSATGSAPFSASQGGAAAIDPEWPTTNCIPLGTRFMVTTGDSMAICQSPVVVKVSAITGDTVLTETAGLINETASSPIPGTNCRLHVFLAEAEGFAEMRVYCN